MTTKDSFSAIERSLKEKTTAIYFSHHLSWLSCQVHGSIAQDLDRLNDDFSFPTFGDIEAADCVDRRYVLFFIVHQAYT